MSNKEATASTVPSSASAAYIPTHAGSDFGKVAIPTTYRNSLVFLYSGKASDKYQYRRHPQYYNDKGQSASHNAPANAATTTATSSPSRVAALGPAANFERLRLSVVNNFYAGDSSENLTDAVPMTPLSPAPLGNRRSSAPLIQSRSPESHRLLRKSRSSLAVTTVTCSDADDEKDDDFVDFDSSDEENSRTTKEQRRKLAKVPKKKNKRDTSTSQRRHSTPGHSPQTSVTELIVSPSTVSLSSVTARPQPLGDSCKKDGKDRLNSKMASLGVKVSEYIKPTTMPDNRLPTMQNIWVGRVD
ncbi:hypothetical protein SBRCBS47491_003215 [Sporothrix bragantina]|uniref:Uncharacterized protein n=1 Tax=Sporothrix bragantina TaxID=671064 RepID=A0ABP0BEC2_9PEZI